MSANRKLQQEIERTLKKVQEGVEVFDATWEKVEASEPDKRDKVEAELKKDLKKLQRYRDQIRGWISSTDVKDNTQLVAARKLIESKMESFKVLERASKTKAFSKEGLAQKRSQMDPTERARAETEDWLTETMQTLEVQIETFEGEIESEMAAVKKNKKPPAKVEELEQLVSQHKEHIRKLEQVLRLLNNEQTTPDMIMDNLKDQLEYYLEACTEPDFIDDDTVYDEFPLDMVDVKDISHNVDHSTSKATVPPTPVPTSPTAAASAAKLEKEKEAEKEREKEKETKPAEKKAVKPMPVTATAPKAASTVPPAKPMVHSAQPPSPTGAAPPSQAWGAAQAALGGAGTETLAKKMQAASLGAESESIDVTPGQAPAPPVGLYAGQAARGVGASGSTAYSLNERASMPPAVGEPQAVQSTGAFPQAHLPPASPGRRPVLKDGMPLEEGKEPAVKPPPVGLEAWRQNVPLPRDGEFRKRQTLTKNPVVPPNLIPASYPKTPLPSIDSPAFFQRLGLDGVFFAFYYQQGTLQQYLAAKLLKAQGWRFHTKFGAWFMRSAPPVAVTEKLEAGPYIYFDPTFTRDTKDGAPSLDGWCQRSKNEMVFEYSYLEDELR
eukprot:scaffold2636_cov340-Pavlova_lutheri.AAC.92